MPIRLNTLDFNLMTKDGKLSDLCEDAIMQAKFIMK
jgi:hypothetical protein